MLASVVILSFNLSKILLAIGDLYPLLGIIIRVSGAGFLPVSGFNRINSLVLIPIRFAIIFNVSPFFTV